MQTMIDNLINGNFKDARTQAKRFSGQKIFKHLRADGWSEKKSFAAAHYLKTGEDFHIYCDAE